MSKPRTFDGMRDKPAPELSADDRETARLLQGPDGIALLRLLKKSTDRSLGPDASSGALQALNAERMFVARLEALFAYGRGFDVEHAREYLWGYPAGKRSAAG